MLKHKIKHSQKVISIKKPKNVKKSATLGSKVLNHSLTSSSKIWLTRHINDQFVKKSQQDGYISRAIYKLTQIEEKFKLIRNSQNILDIGSSPGSWLQAIIKIKQRSQQISNITAIDLLPLSDLFYQTSEYNSLSANKKINLSFINGDFCDKEMQSKLMSSINDSSYDLILSDLSPERSGNSRADHLEIMSIIDEIILFALSHLRYCGSLIFKTFHGEELELKAKELRKIFEEVKYFKPVASRQESAEIYIICLKKLLQNKS